MPEPRLNLVGQTFGRLLVTAMINVRYEVTRCVVKCECGTVTEIRMKQLRNGRAKSCGCLRTDRLSERTTRHGLSDHPAYDTWLGMHRRCYEKAHRYYRDYGGRGIAVCQEWHRDNLDGLKNFCQWFDKQGYQPGLTVDRKNNDSDYSPSNCRLASPAQQAANRRKR